MCVHMCVCHIGVRGCIELGKDEQKQRNFRDTKQNSTELHTEGEKPFLVSQ